jgi:Tol biopolymer transport system component
MLLTFLVLLTFLIFLSGCGGSPSAYNSTNAITFVSARNGDYEIYRINPDGSGLKNLTDHPKEDRSQVWSSNKKKIAFASRRDGNDEIYVANADGTGQTRLTNNTARDFNPVWQ